MKKRKAKIAQVRFKPSRVCFDRNRRYTAFAPLRSGKGVCVIGKIICESGIYKCGRLDQGSSRFAYCGRRGKNGKIKKWGDVGSAVLKIWLTVVVVVEVHLLLENLVDESPYRQFLPSLAFAAEEGDLLEFVIRYRCQ